MPLLIEEESELKDKAKILKRTGHLSPLISFAISVVVIVISAVIAFLYVFPFLAYTLFMDFLFSIVVSVAVFIIVGIILGEGVVMYAAYRERARKEKAVRLRKMLRQ